MTNYSERLDDLLTELRSGTINFDDKSKQAITSLIKELVAEARIDEMKLHRHEWELFGDRPPYKGESVSLPILLAYHDDRITELKAQKEKV